MREFVCVTKCFYNNVLYAEGSPYIATDDEKVPHHFEERGKVEAKKEAKVEEVNDGIVTLQKQLDALGKPYDRRWGIPRLEGALHEAKLEKGE
ncbi:MAG: hypothetical protein WA066_03015 [Candidatus Omnitrophota bacterium]